MGMIVIDMYGSFPLSKRRFAAELHGHAAAVAEAITYLSGQVMQSAIRLDHRLQTEGHMPLHEFGWPETGTTEKSGREPG